MTFEWLQQRYPDAEVQIAEQRGTGVLYVTVMDGNEIHLAFPIDQAENVRIAILQLASMPNTEVQALADYVTKHALKVSEMQGVTGLLALDELMVRESRKLN